MKTILLLLAFSFSGLSFAERKTVIMCWDIDYDWDLIIEADKVILADTPEGHRGYPPLTEGQSIQFERVPSATDGVVLFKHKDSKAIYAYHPDIEIKAVMKAIVPKFHDGYTCRKQ